jgi:PTH2 family peptidyl-tRNA hydrolase
MSTKQVIVMRKDLNMRKGKMIAQGSHASMAFLTKSGGVYCNLGTGIPQVDYFMSPVEESHVQEINHWLRNSFRKICVYVNSEEELEAVHQKAIDSGLMSHMIEDNGATEFNGVKTKTCCAIGPHSDEKFEGVTDHLPLL